MFRRLTATVRFLFRAVGFGAAGAIIALIAIYVAFLESRPDLSPWHEVFLDNEFKAESDVRTLAEYLTLEERLFAALDREIYTDRQRSGGSAINRYSRGSLSDPEIWPRNWNRTFDLESPDPKAGVLLLHGMSDSPYSLRALGEKFHANGAWVTGLRLPGHGTIPSGLTGFRWEDMAAAVRLGMKHLKEKVGDGPIHIVGYSNGGALAVQYALESITDQDLPRAARIVLISPAIGVTPAAAFAVWQARLGHLLELDKLEWTDIQPEYDPFKYNSFAVNAGDQVFRLTSRIAEEIRQLSATGALLEMPPILAFQSVMDATVSVPAVVNSLFAKLPQGGHELVMFDINRQEILNPLIDNDPGPGIEALLAQAAPTFTLSFLTVENASTRNMQLIQRTPNATQLQRQTLDLQWPRDTYSLSHVALPFPPDDPLYGSIEPESLEHMFLGDMAMRGERGLLQVPPSAMLRLRWNPFYDYLESRTLEFLQMDAEESSMPVAVNGNAVEGPLGDGTLHR